MWDTHRADSLCERSASQEGNSKGRASLDIAGLRKSRLSEGNQQLSALNLYHETVPPEHLVGSNSCSQILGGARLPHRPEQLTQCSTEDCHPKRHVQSYVMHVASCEFEHLC